MKIYNKLVRDEIPKIIRESGKTCEITILNKKQYLLELKKKLIEESNELLNAKTKEDIIEEIVDVTDVINAIINEEKIKLSNIEGKREEKNQQKGSFKKRYFLKHVSSK